VLDPLTVDEIAAVSAAVRASEQFRSLSDLIRFITIELGEPHKQEPLAAHLSNYVALQRQMVRAALSGDRRAALHAFLLEPTIAARLDLEQTQALLDEMLSAYADQLPLFGRN
jgi:alpha-galactosidase/6-phospho-beta-glucosidase family protein